MEDPRLRDSPGISDDVQYTEYFMALYIIKQFVTIFWNYFCHHSWQTDNGIDRQKMTTVT